MTIHRFAICISLVFCFVISPAHENGVWQGSRTVRYDGNEAEGHITLDTKEKRQLLGER